MVQKQVLMVGKVMSDLSNIFYVLNLTNDKMYSVIVILQASLVFIYLIVMTLHFTAIMIYQVDIPIGQFTQFLKQNFLYEQIQYNQNSPVKSFERVKSSTIDKSKIECLKINQEESKYHYLNNTKRIDKSNLSCQRLINSNQGLQFNNSGHSIYKKDNQVEQKGQPIKLSYQKGRQGLSNFSHQKEDKYLQTNLTHFESIQNYSFGLKKYQSVEPLCSSPQRKIKQKILQGSLDNQDDVIQESSMVKQSGYSQFSINDPITQVQDIEPMFLEMKIISQAFQQLGEVIAYKQSDLKQNQFLTNQKKNDEEENIDLPYVILHYSFAVRIFQSIKNNYGQSLSRINLGYFYQKKNDYLECLLQFELALNNVLLEINYSSIEDFIKDFRNGNIVVKGSLLNESMNVICTTLILQAHAIKQIILDRRDLHQNYKIKEIFTSEKCKWLKRALLLIDFYKELTQNFYRNKEYQQREQIQHLMETEYIEICIELKDFHIAKNRFIQLTQTNQYQMDQSSISQESDQESFNQINTIGSENNLLKTLIQAKITYIYALLSTQQQNFKYASENFTVCLEKFQHLDSILQRKCLENLMYIFLKSRLPIKEIKNTYSSLNCRPQRQIFDIVILVEGSLGITLTFANEIKEVLNYMYDSFIVKKDRISFLVFQNSKTRIIQPLVQIEKQKQWKFCLESIYNLSTQLAQEIFNSQLTQEEANQENQVQDVYISRNPDDTKYKYQFIKLQQESKKYILQNKNNISRESLFFVFSNSNVDLINNNFNIKSIIQSLSKQFSSTPQTIHLELLQNQPSTEKQEIISQLLNKNTYIQLQTIDQLKFVINYYKRHDTNNFYVADTILNYSCL